MVRRRRPPDAGAARLAVRRPEDGHVRREAERRGLGRAQGAHRGRQGHAGDRRDVPAREGSGCRSAHGARARTREDRHHDLSESSEVAEDVPEVLRDAGVPDVVPDRELDVRDLVGDQLHALGRGDPVVRARPDVDGDRDVFEPRIGTEKQTGQRAQLGGRQNPA